MHLTFVPGSFSWILQNESINSLLINNMYIMFIFTDEVNMNYPYNFVQMPSLLGVGKCGSMEQRVTYLII